MASQAASHPQAAAAQGATAETTGPPVPTDLVYQADAKRYTLETVVESVLPYAELPAANRALFKAATESADDGSAAPAYYAVVTRATIFHPQGGGQPSDVGTIAEPGGGDAVFHVLSARMDAVSHGRVLHFGVAGSATADRLLAAFASGRTVTQTIDAAKRLLYSRLHTAGHVLGAAVRHVVEQDVPGFDELKASHFPDAASCEFRGRIDGHWKEPIQARLSAYVDGAMPVQIEWWDAAAFRENGLERLIPQAPPGPMPREIAEKEGAGGSGKWRVVRIVGAEAYPCGGTHVDTTDLCGATRVTKISRSKGISRVSYAVDS